MKNILISTAIVLLSVNAMATRARLNALGNARHLLDIQSFANNPSDIHALGDYAYIEFGNNTDVAVGTPGFQATSNSSLKREGGFLKSIGDGKLAVYLGRRSDSSATLVSAANAFVLNGTNFVPYEQNPIDVVYGHELGGHKVAYGLHYASGSYDSYSIPLINPSTGAVIGNTTAFKGSSSAIGAYAGLRGDNYDYYVRVGLGGGAKNDTAGTELKPNGYLRVGGRYAVDTITYFADVTQSKAEVSGTGVTTTKATANDLQVGMVNNHKLDSGAFFYGVSYLSSEQIKEDAQTQKNTIAKIPLLIGMEVNAADWMIFRGSVTQSIFVGDTKAEFVKAALGQTAGKDSMKADTVVSTGVGFKWSKVMLDTTLSGSTTGVINGASLFANTSLVYNM